MLIIPNASSTVKGIAKLSLNPVVTSIPIAVGDNDPRNTDARTPLPHHTTHEAPSGGDIVQLEESQVTNLIYDLGDYLCGYGFFGDGSDGDINIIGTTILTRDMFYRNLTVPSGSNLLPSGYRLYVYDTLTLNGVISDSGSV